MSLPLAPSPPNPFPSTQHTDRDTTLSPLSPPPPRLPRSSRQHQHQQGKTTTTPLRNAIPCVGQARRIRTPQRKQNGPRQRRAASGVNVDVDVDVGAHECYRPSMAGWWECCQCEGLNNPGLTPEKCPTCDHSLCNVFCKVFPS